jgi:hypothetical protein
MMVAKVNKRMSNMLSLEQCAGNFSSEIAKCTFEECVGGENVVYKAFEIKISLENFFKTELNFNFNSN